MTLTSRPAGLPLVLLLSLLTLVTPRPGFAATPDEADEHDAKAAFVYAFAKFVGWPDRRPADPPTFAIGIVGSHSVLAAMQALEGKRVHDLPVEILHLPDANGLQPCRVLVCSVAELEQALAQSPHAAVGTLTVRDEDGFAEAGGVLQLTFVDEHLGFVINRAAARRAGLQLSSSLFNLATLVIDDDGLDTEP